MRESCFQCIECHKDFCIKNIPIFSSLSREDIEKISSLMTHREYKRGEMIFMDGERVDSIIIICEGSVKAFKDTADGREQILYVFSEGDFFGIRNILNDRTATFHAEALQALKACILSKRQFQTLLYEHPDIAVKIIEILSNRMVAMENAMQGMGVRNIDNRVGGLLLEYAERYGSIVEEGLLIQLPLSREGIANYLGVARETISRKLSQLENDGIIRSISNKSILILNQKALEQLAGL